MVNHQRTVICIVSSGEEQEIINVWQMNLHLLTCRVILDENNASDGRSFVELEFLLGKCVFFLELGLFFI